MRTKALLLLLPLAMLLLYAPDAPAQDRAVLMQARTAAKLRQERNTESAVVGRLDAGQPVKAGFAADDWLAVFPPDSPAENESDRLGYVYAPLLVPAAGAQTAAAPGPAPAPAPTEAPAEAKPAPAPAAVQPAPYTVLARQVVQRAAGPWLECAALLTASAMPGPDDLKVLAAQVRSGLAASEPRVAVHLYLPGLDLSGPSYAVARFEGEVLAEFWTRDTVLFGTPWARFIH
ncbi:MAG: SH3 domain-containing protein [Thermodesulfobacteriota bacterium]